MIPQANISAIIPQQPPFVMIDQLISCDETCSNTTFRVTADNVLVDAEELSEAGLIENIAQTAAAGLGYNTLQSNKPVVIGYIASIKNLEIFARPKVGDLLITNVIITNQIFDITIISGNVKCDGVLLAKCEMKIYLKNKTTTKTT